LRFALLALWAQCQAYMSRNAILRHDGALIQDKAVPQELIQDVFP